MEISDIRWWHCIVVSLIVGFCLSYAYNGMEILPDTPGVELVQFEADIETPAFVDAANVKHNWVKDVTVYPVTTIQSLEGETHKVQVVTYKVPVQSKNNPSQWQWQPRWFTSNFPFAPTNSRIYTQERLSMLASKTLPPGIEQLYVPKPEDTATSIAQVVYHDSSSPAVELIRVSNQYFRHYPTIALNIAHNNVVPGEPVLIPFALAKQKGVQEWLDGEKANVPGLTYQYAWWRVPRTATALAMGGSFLVLGVVTPAVLSLLASVGIGNQPRRKEMDLSRYGKRESVKSKIKPSSTVMTPEELDQLNAFEERVKAGLADAVPAPAATVEKVATAPQREMTNQALPAPVHAADEEEIKEFGGQFYPVVVAVHKPGEEPHAPGTPPPSHP